MLVMSCRKTVFASHATIPLLLLSCRVESHRRTFGGKVQIMPQSVAVAIVHGIGRQKEDFASSIIQQLRMRVRQQLGEDAQEAPRSSSSESIGLRCCKTKRMTSGSASA